MCRVSKERTSCLRVEAKANLRPKTAIERTSATDGAYTLLESAQGDREQESEREGEERRAEPCAGSGRTLFSYSFNFNGHHQIEAGSERQPAKSQELRA